MTYFSFISGAVASAADLYRRFHNGDRGINLRRALPWGKALRQSGLNPEGGAYTLRTAWFKEKEGSVEGSRRRAARVDPLKKAG